MPPSKPDRYPFQTAGVEFLQDRGRAFLGDEAGLGKSRQLIEASAGKTLVVAPAMVLDSGNWDEQVNLWGDDPSRFHQVSYSGLNARKKTGKTASSTRPTTALHDRVRALGRIQTLILDEAHYVKGRSTFWTHAVKSISKYADQVFLATGTPIPNWPHELFVPLQLLRPDLARPGGQLGAYQRWLHEWFRTTPSQFDPHGEDVLGLLRCRSACAERPPYDPCEHYYEFVAENLGDQFLMRRREDVLGQLPPLTQVEIKVPMTAKQAAEYSSMRKDYLATVNDQEVVAWSSASRNVLLDRMTTGLGVVTDAAGAFSSAESGKFKRLEFDLSSRSRPTLVLAHYRASVEVCAQVARSLGCKAGIIHGGTSRADRGSQVRAFQAGQLDVLCGSLETISEGVTLTAADMTIFVERSYKPSRNEQALRRIHRIGQTRPCTALDYVSVTPRGGRTLDGTKRELLARKTDQQMRVLTATQFRALLV